MGMETTLRSVVTLCLVGCRLWPAGVAFTNGVKSQRQQALLVFLGDRAKRDPSAHTARLVQTTTTQPQVACTRAAADAWLRAEEEGRRAAEAAAAAAAEAAAAAALPKSKRRRAPQPWVDLGTEVRCWGSLVSGFAIHLAQVRQTP